MTAGVTADDFPTFFRAVHGVDPFPWQTRLLRDRVSTGQGWPAVLDLPTASGKTAALDIALFHLAMEAGAAETRRAPMRIAFVVDRRLIVDDAFARAKKLQWALALPQCEVTERVAAALRSFAGEQAPPLLARRLRGGAPREDDWARTPNQPTILCSTVDQVGSRLLFRGYGISDRMKPVHAGLLGSDCLILLDEAHLAEPFRQTLASIAELRGEDVVVAPWRVVLLSATPGLPQAEDLFSLDDDDRAHPLLAQRLGAAKPAALVEIAGKQGVAAETRRVEEIADRAIGTLAELKRDIPSPAVGVVVNRVARARSVFERLSGTLPASKVMLIIGPARLADREKAVIEDLQPIRTGATRSLATPLVVVSTQTIEAGVDIDFDGLVTEAAALDSLRQRFGRLNRAGRPVKPVAAILAHRDDLSGRADVDAVYGDRIAKTWDALNGTVAPGAEPIVDFGISGFPETLVANSASLAAARKDAPIVLPAYVDLWSQTSPIPNADPDPALFLHGPERAPASVQVVWRADITAADFDHRQRISELLDLIPPRSAEAVEIPLWAARAWLRRDVAAEMVLSDLAEKAPDEADERRGRRVFRYAGSDDLRRTGAASAEDLRDGDLIVVPTEYGGCDRWGWAPGSTDMVKDLAEKAAEPYAGRRLVVRVTPALILQWSAGPEDEAETLPTLDATRQTLSALLAEHRDEAASELLDAVLALPRLPSEMGKRLEKLKHRKGRRLNRVFAYGCDADERPSGVIFIAPNGIREPPAGPMEEYADGDPATEDDGLGSAPGFAQTLEEHSQEVREWAIEFAKRLGIATELAEDISLAAYLHDQGKADPRFQAMLYGGDWFAIDETRVLAKSAGAVGPAAWTKAGLPERWRHEALSVRLAREHPRFCEAHDPELVLWLVGVHHGYGRPLYPHADPQEPQDDAGPQRLDFDFEGSDWAQIFDSLKLAYGVWGLARLEAIVRLADHRASEAAARRYTEQTKP
jgi:CRISPR-associated endonuclease/helicase Cas3